jgi:hypothetical protein
VSQSFLIGRPTDGGTKFLRKNESTPYCPGSDHAGDAAACEFCSVTIEYNADNTAHLSDIGSVYEALTPIGKDCGKIGQKSIKRAFGATNAGPRWNSLQSSNGE